MSLENAKIADRISIIGKKLKMGIDKKIKEVAQKYKMELTKSVINYSRSLIKEKIDEIISLEAEKFRYIRILVDYGICEPELETILSIAKDIKENLAGDVPAGADSANLTINPDDSMKMIILEFPAEWGTEFVNDYRRMFLEKLRQKDIVKV